jgi:hypothetical protein
VKLINASKAYDGQGAFLNGIHDGVSLPRYERLYRAGYARARIQHAVWCIGFAIGRLLPKSIVDTKMRGIGLGWPS